MYSASNGYVPRIDAGPGIFAGECLVTNANNKANLLFINATAEDVELTMAPVALITFDTIDKKAVRIARTVSGEANSASPDERVEKIMQSLALEGLNAVEMNSVREIVSKFPFQFHLPLDKLSLTGSGAHRIVTSDDIPINIKQYRYPPHLRDEMRKHVQEFIDNNIVEESESPYNFPLWIVPKKAGPDGVKKWRLVIDLRALNEKTIASAYPLPQITEILDQLGKSKYFSRLKYR
uniref:Reverse transcriptase domain-containing protein n=1 Tax=Trichogramma kaykai TaxID=54128 RepID=A0ABD2VTR8_9HYME